MKTKEDVLKEYCDLFDIYLDSKEEKYILRAMKEYTKMKCKELLEIVVDKAQVEDFGYTVSSYSITNAVDLDEFVK